MSHKQGISGTPWHHETLRKKPNDSARSRKRCINFDPLTKKCSCQMSPYMNFLCGCVSHCRFYKEDVNKTSKIKQDK